MKLFLVFILSLTSFSFTAQTANFLKFDQRLIDLGEVIKGEKKEMVFHLENISEEDILIDLISACECTEIDWPVKAIKPGEKVSLTAIFDSTKKDKTEIIDIDIILKNRDPKTGNPIFETVQYTYLLKE